MLAAGQTVSKLALLNKEADVVCSAFQRGAALHHDHSPSAPERGCPVFLVKQRPLPHSGGKTKMLHELPLKISLYLTSNS